MHYLLYYILTACLKKGVIMAKQKYYVVWAGRKTGIFSSWEACQSQVNGFKGARFKSFPSKAEAEAAFKADSETQKTKSSRPLPNKKIDKDRKSTRLNSSHVAISYAVFCLKKKKKTST